MSAQPKRGHLKVYMGAVPGVGKTFRMLSEAHRRKERGQDVVIGLVETHGRKATAELTKGLEQVPLKEITYREKVFKEMDTGGVIKRHPECVLIDELAHTNVPGSRHDKRWQSIDEIIGAGINVLSTVNIQHLESMNDAVYEITGVRVRETVPDSVIDEADEVELIDLPPDAIINRLVRGDIYGHDKVSQALANFFTKPNLVALRELVLRKTAEEVDEQLDEIMARSQAFGRKVAHDYVVVCVTPRPESGKLIRRGYHIAKRLKTKFSVVMFRFAGAALGEDTEKVVKQLNKLTKFLGGQFVELVGDSVAEEIIKYVNSTRTTMMIMGQSKRHRLNEVFSGSIVNHVMREVDNVDIILVASEPGDG
jgi:two-component system, OmpR family, sensor histidine kinase KdpD